MYRLTFKSDVTVFFPLSASTLFSIQIVSFSLSDDLASKLFCFFFSWLSLSGCKHLDDFFGRCFFSVWHFTCLICSRMEELTCNVRVKDFHFSKILFHAVGPGKFSQDLQVRLSTYSLFASQRFFPPFFCFTPLAWLCLHPVTSRATGCWGKSNWLRFAPISIELSPSKWR